MQTYTILVTQAEYDKAADVFAAAAGLDCCPAPAEETALAALVRDTGCRAVVLGVAPYRDALYDALAANAGDAGAATDVFMNEPYVPVAPDKDLRTLPNVVLTPHCGSNTLEANARMAASAIMQAKAFLNGSNAIQAS